MKKKFLLIILFVTSLGFAQVTKSSMSGTIKSTKGELLPGATVEVIHQPTGTKYYSTSDSSGAYSVPSIRPGGPFVVNVTYMGFKPATVTDITAPLGNNVTVNVKLEDEATTLQEVVVSVKKPASAFSKGRTGASQQFSTREINAVPTLGARSINSITKYNANAGSGGSFGGQDSRLNNFTIDGSVFNNGFGLGGDTQAGGRTGSTAISLDAIEQLQVNIAPYDVRQSGFTGSGINAVTRSGSNEWEGSAYHSWRSNKKEYVGTKAGEVEIIPTQFSEQIYGARLGLPIIKNKLFFFGNVEKIENISPATTWVTSDTPNAGTQLSAPTTNEMQTLSDFMQQKFNYTTGPWQNYDAERGSIKFLGRLDWNINKNHTLTARYVHHDSNQDELTSNSSSLGNGNRRTNQNSMSFKNSGYVIKDNTRSYVLELDSKINDKWSNNFIAGYDKQIEDRALQDGSKLFPTIDILNGAPSTTLPGTFTNGSLTKYSVGLDPFTPGNKLNYSTLHFTNNVTGRFGKHTFVLGANFERFISNNNFFPGSEGAYIFNSVEQFYAAANEALANGGLQPTTITTNLPVRTQFRYSALPGQAEPLQILKSTKIDLYAQDEVKVSDNFRFTVGLRASRVSFANTALENPDVAAMTFANGEKFNTGKMPKTQYIFEPRIGFNLDVNGDATTQVRGGSGVFTGRPPLVMLSNAIGNNGVLTGFVDAQGANNVVAGNYGFTANPNQYFVPSTPTKPSSYELAFTDTNFKFPQVWKTNIAVDQKLPFGFVATIEGIFSQNINAIDYYNANLANPTGSINNSNGDDTRPYYAGNADGVRVVNNVSSAVVLTNTNKGYFYSSTFKLDYPYNRGLWGSIAYTHSGAYDKMSAGSIAAGSWTGSRSVNGNNNLPVTISDNNTPHRIVGILGYKIEYGKTIGGATSFNLGYIGEQARPFSYTSSGDLNGDTVNGNDLIFVPKKGSDLRFVDITQNFGGVNQVLYTAAQQAEAFDKYIDQDPYLKNRRGQYAQRNSNVLPMLHRLDLSVTQDLVVKIKGKKNSFQFRADILNFTNLLNRDWGVSKRATNNVVLNLTQAPNAGNNYTPGYQLPFQTDNTGKRFLIKDTFQKNSSVFDVWQAQFTVRYTFGN